MTRASFVPETFDSEKRTVEIVWTTGARVSRWSWTEGSYNEELSLQKSHVNLDRLNAGAPVLNNHRSGSLEDSIGVVEKAWIKNKEGRAIVRFSEREEVAGIVRDVESGVIRNISVGYSVQKYEDVTKKGEETKTFRAVDWTPMELSFVNIPADMDSQVRSAENKSYDVLIVRNQEVDMDDNNVENTQDKKPVVESTLKVSDKPVVDVVKERSEAKAEGQKLEMERQTSIRSLCDSVDLKDESEKLINDKKTVSEANSEIIRMIAERNAKKPTNGQTGVDVDDVSNANKRRECVVSAIENCYPDEALIKKSKMIDGARDFAGHDIIEIARRYMDAEGIDTRNLTNQEIARLSIGKSLGGYGERSNTTSDFPFIVADVSNNRLQQAYQEQEQTFESFTTSRTVGNTKNINSTLFGDAPVLEQVNEKGEYKKGTISEGKEVYKIRKYGKMIEVSEELMMNDELGAFLQLAAKFGARSRELESDIVWAIITDNDVMGDGVALFNTANHGNLAGSGAIFDVTTVGAGRLAMRLQVGLDGAKINVAPRTLVVPAALETEAEKFLAIIRPAKDSDTNPFKGLSLVSEVRLDDDSAVAWYLFATKAQAERIEIARLRGQETPQIETKLAFETDSMTMKIKYWFAAKAQDHRAFFKNPGV